MFAIAGGSGYFIAILYSRKGLVTVLDRGIYYGQIRADFVPALVERGDRLNPLICLTMASVRHNPLSISNRCVGTKDRR